MLLWGEAACPCEETLNLLFVGERGQGKQNFDITEMKFTWHYQTQLPHAKPGDWDAL
jgi:hypothetical protein